MKLNNKGFAFSTLLYGLLAIITLLLAIIFASYKQAYDETYYYSAVMEESMNKCIDQELALENCYRSGYSYCNKSAYYSCLGYEDSSESLKDIFKDRLIALSSDSSSNFKEITGSDLKYIYQGETVDNYVRFSNMLWRVVGITEEGEVKLVLAPTDATYEWDTKDRTEWRESSLQNYLNNDFLDSIANTNVITKYAWKVGKIDITDINNVKVSDIKALEDASLFTAKVGLISSTDVINTSSTVCTTDTKIYDGSSNCIKSWLTETWLITGSDTDSKHAFFYNATNKKLEHAVLSTPGEEEGSDPTYTKHMILPSIYLDKNIKSIKDVGDGSNINPYVLEY